MVHVQNIYFGHYLPAEGHNVMADTDPIRNVTQFKQDVYENTSFLTPLIGTRCKRLSRIQMCLRTQTAYWNQCCCFIILETNSSSDKRE